MEIEQRSSGSVLVLPKEDLIALREFFNLHLLIPRFRDGDTVDSTTDSWEVFGQLIRVFDLVLENKKENKYE
jgi:hypothetical protein